MYESFFGESPLLLKYQYNGEDRKISYLLMATKGTKCVKLNGSCVLHMAMKVEQAIQSQLKITLQHYIL